MTEANTAAESVTGGGVPAPVTDMSERDGRSANLDQSSTANPQFLNPNPSGLPSVLNPTLPRPAATPIPVPHMVPPAVSGSQFLFQPYQIPGIPPPGVGPAIVAPSALVASGSLPQVPVASLQNIMAQPYGPGGQPLRFGTPIPNGYGALPQGAPPGVIPPPVYP